MQLKKHFLLVTCLGLLVVTVMFPKQISSGIINGILVSGNVLIPSLFPFAVIAVFIFKSGILSCIVKNKYTAVFFIYFMSAIGGYPIGAKIISEELGDGRIDKKCAETLLMFCVNSGPSFVVTFVGFTVFSSRIIGFFLLIAHITASLEMMAINFNKLKKLNYIISRQKARPLSEAFVESVSSAAASMIDICSYVILFSGIISLLGILPFKSEILKALVGLLEVTNALLNVKNIYAASFLLGFGGFCIIFQIITIAKNFLSDILKFTVFRIIHGLLSCANLFLILKIFKISVPTFSNCKNLSFSATNSGFIMSVMLIAVSIILIYTLSTRKISGKFAKDILEI